LTLLGNTYRQLGMLEQSRRVLYEARNNHPDHYFPLYGFGRTLLAQGHYAEAAENIALALERGAPPAVYFDLGEAHYREQNTPQAIENLHKAREYAEPHRRLMAIYLLYQLGQSDPPDHLLVEQSIAYWQAQAELFAETPYGQALAEDVDTLLAMTTKP
jgi:tetratricopeptide (TPR) repeat protein